MNYILADNGQPADFYPLTLTRPLGALRIGISTIAQKWERFCGQTLSFHVPEYLKPFYSFMADADNLVLSSRVLADTPVWEAITGLRIGEGLYQNGQWIASRLGHFEGGTPIPIPKQSLEYTRSSLTFLLHPEDFIRHNARQIELDYAYLTQARRSALWNQTNQVLGSDLFLEEGVTMNFAILNSQKGPIYIGAGVEIMEGALIRGPVAIMNDSVVKMGAKLYGGTTIGPHCTVGGEIKNTLLQAYSNKAHEGYLGDSFLGQWCNLGADTNNSNLKNNYKPVSLFDYSIQKSRQTDLLFLGVIMGDHVKCGINSTLNTGTVVGMGVNWFGPEVSPSFIPDFTWSNSGQMETYQLEKMLETCARVFHRKGKEMSALDIQLYRHTFALTENLRRRTLEAHDTNR